VADDAVDEIWCLGDTVGYGPSPNDACAIVSGRAAVGLVGNHDLIALDKANVSVAEFNPDAGAAAVWTQRVLDGASRGWLESLQPELRRHGVALFHGSPVDPVWDYVLTLEDAHRSLELTTENLVLVGHTHVPIAANETEGTHAPAGTEVDLSAGRWILNPGSVGQPRDGDPRAAYLLLELDVQRALFRRLTYPVERTQDAMREAGLPEALAQRLAYGV
jgi:diadenosine tetraphosphatase ApaH/serine/threonine PP2A family protein phosphatase